MLLTNVAIVFKFMTFKFNSNFTESTNQALAKSTTRGTAMVVTRGSDPLVPSLYEFNKLFKSQHQWCFILHCGNQIPNGTIEELKK